MSQFLLLKKYDKAKPFRAEKIRKRETPLLWSSGVSRLRSAAVQRQPVGCVLTQPHLGATTTQRTTSFTLETPVIRPAHQAFGHSRL